MHNYESRTVMLQFLQLMFDAFNRRVENNYYCGSVQIVHCLSLFARVGNLDLTV